MNEIKCPNCKTVFQIEEKDYLSIVKQIRDQEFEKEIEEKKEQYEKEKDVALALQEATLNEKYSEKLNKKELEINTLADELKQKEENVKNKLEKEHLETLRKQEEKIADLEKTVEVQEMKSKLDLQQAITEKEKTIDALTSTLELTKKEYALKENTLKDSYEAKLKDKDEIIAYYKDFKAKQSTKMVGESLEVHCKREFDKLRPLFQHATFEKDNDARTGSKGDFIFRDYDEDKNEIVSIMFEMKNERDETATKHKNEDFLKELDKDRREKHCEYAVLVTLLEQDNDYYNDGIVDASHIYEKMYIIRPQFFIPLITLIRNLAAKSVDYRKELERIKMQNIDITHFEENIETFKEGFGRNYRLASDRFKKAIEEIDKSIDHLQKIKENLQKADDNLRLANNKAEDLTIQKLTRNNPTMKEMFEKQRKENKFQKEKINEEMFSKESQNEKEEKTTQEENSRKEEKEAEKEE